MVTLHELIIDILNFGFTALDLFIFKSSVDILLENRRIQRLLMTEESLHLAIVKRHERRIEKLEEYLKKSSTEANNYD